MSCMKQEFCIHEKYCQRHIGQNFDSCILFSRNSKPMTNEEYLKSCNTEQLAEWIADKSNEIISWIICEVIENECDVDEDDYWQKKSDVLEWLKQPHTNEQE